MIEKMADDLIGQMTEARLIDKDMEERYIYKDEVALKIDVRAIF